MKKALIVKSEFVGRKVGEIHEINEAKEINSRGGNLYNKMVKVEIPAELEGVDKSQLKGSLIPSLPEKWTKDGEADVSENPNDVSWTYVPAVKEHWEIVKGDNFKDYDKKKRVGDKFQILNSEVVEEMKQVYNTTNPDSAVANYLTWLAMKNNPSKFSDKNLVARFDIVGLTIGDPLDKNKTVEDYAVALIDKADDYAIWREQKIIAYISEKLAIENE